MSTEVPEKKSYKTTLNLPQTTFAMEAKLVQNEPARLKTMAEEAHLYETHPQVNRARTGKGKWILHDGPPFANGDIHIGHVINKTLKDVILKFRTMAGLSKPHTYPAGIATACRSSTRFSEEIKKEGRNIREMSTVLQVRQATAMNTLQNMSELQCEQFQAARHPGRMGEHPYLTMEPGVRSRARWKFLRSFVEAGLVYRTVEAGAVVDRESDCALADAELEYQDKTDQSVYVEFELVSGADSSVGRSKLDVERSTFESDQTSNVQRPTFNVRQ